MKFLFFYQFESYLELVAITYTNLLSEKPHQPPEYFTINSANKYRMVQSNPSIQMLLDRYWGDKNWTGDCQELYKVALLYCAHCLKDAHANQENIILLKQLLPGRHEKRMTVWSGHLTIICPGWVQKIQWMKLTWMEKLLSWKRAV